jgi:hypothetical protein
LVKETAKWAVEIAIKVNEYVGMEYIHKETKSYEKENEIEIKENIKIL